MFIFVLYTSISVSNLCRESTLSHAPIEQVGRALVAHDARIRDDKLRSVGQEDIGHLERIEVDELGRARLSQRRDGLVHAATLHAHVAFRNGARLGQFSLKTTIRWF